MRRTLCHFRLESDVLTALQLQSTHRPRQKQAKWATNADYYRQLGLLKMADRQVMSNLLTAENCPQSPLQVSKDAAGAGVVLTDRSVSSLMIHLADILKKKDVSERAECLEEGIELQWHARKVHVFGQRSMAALIYCCSLVPDLETALNVIDLAGRHATTVMYRSLLLVCRNARDYTRAKQIWTNLATKDDSSYRIYLQTLVYAKVPEKEIYEVFTSLPKPREDHCVIALSGIHTVEYMQKVVTYMQGKTKRTPSVNAEVVRVLLEYDMLREAELVAAKQKVVTEEVHGELLKRVPGLKWVEELMVEAGLREAVVGRRKPEVVNDLQDKTMAALFAVGSCVANTAMAVPLVAASMGAVAGSAAVGSNGDSRTAAGASILGTAALAGAALAGSPPAAAGAVGSMMAFTSAAAFNYYKKASVPVALLPSELVPTLLEAGTATHAGPLDPLVPTISASPLPLTLRRVDRTFTLTVQEPRVRYTKQHEVGDGDYTIVLELIGEGVPFRVLPAESGKGVVFTW